MSIAPFSVPAGARIPPSRRNEDPRRFGADIESLDNDHCIYTVDGGMSPDEATEPSRLLDNDSSRTLVCNGSHIPQLAHSRQKLDSLERPLGISAGALRFCEPDDLLLTNR